MPGPARSQVPGTSKLGAGLQGAPSTTSARPVGQTTTALSQNLLAAAGGGASTVTLNPVTWVQPVQNVGGAVVGNHNTLSTVGGAGGPSTTLQCAQGTPRQSKSSPRGTPTTKGKGNTSTSNLCLESNTKSQPAQSRGGPITGPDNSAPTVRGCSVPAARKGIHGSTKTRKPGVRVPPHKRGIRHRATWMFGQEIRALGADLPKARTVHLSERTTLGPPSQPLVCPRHRSAHTEGARLATRPLLELQLETPPCLRVPPTRCFNHHYLFPPSAKHLWRTCPGYRWFTGREHRPPQDWTICHACIPSG